MNSTGIQVGEAARSPLSYDGPVARESSPSVRVLAEPFGAAEVIDLDPADATSRAAAGALLREALSQRGVVCVRSATARSDAEMRALAGMIGPVKDPVARTRAGAMLRYGDDRQIIDAGFVLTDELRAELGDVSFGGDSLRPGLFETFHTDDSYVQRPAAATVLHALELPREPGGDTCFIDMRAAFRLLAPERQAHMLGRRAGHSYNNRGAFPPRVSAEGPFEQLVDVAHPIVRAHPVTGEPALYFDLDRATHIEGLPEAEGRALLQSLQDHAETHAPRYAHAWQPNDVLIWDNASVQHKASGDFPVGEPRRFWRYMIEGPIPAAFAPAPGHSAA
jgi:alpha-ketoglutarate-dependent taurine dioxygenase